MEIIEATQEECEMRAAEIVAGKINETISRKGNVVLGLVGGSSVSGVYKILAEKDINWSSVHMFWADERCVSQYSVDSNYKLAKDSFIDGLIESGKLPAVNVHPFIYNPESAVSGLRKYIEEFEKYGKAFDVVLLSVGEDGHVASLFPRLGITKENDMFFYLNDSPKPPAKRMTASRRLLERSGCGIALFFGKNKNVAFEKFKDDKITISECPAKLINKVIQSYAFHTKEDI